jgi:hypothetical protein
VEIAGVAHHGDIELLRALRGPGDAHLAFVVISGCSNALEIAQAMSRSPRVFGGAQVCAAITSEMLSKSDPRSLRELDIGILLDEVNAQTPLGAVSADYISAIRLEREFLASASRNIRLSCVVTSFLQLAADLGLATLGSAAPSTLPMLEAFEFDYLPST